MKHRATIMIMLLAWVLVSGACRETDQLREHPVTHEEVETIVSQYDKAWKAQNLSAIDSIMASDYLYFSSKGGMRSRQWMLEELLGAPGYEIEALSRTEMVIQIYHETAVVGSRWKGSGRFNGAPFRDDQRCSQVFVKEKTGLLLASEHCTEIES